MGRALPCLIRIVAACPRSRLIRVCASHNKTFPGHEAFILIKPGRRDPCSQDSARVRRKLAAGRPKEPKDPQEPAGAPRRRSQRYDGTDRQCRGRLLAVLRHSGEPVGRADFDAVWPGQAQLARALDGLIADGLVDPLPDGRFALPGSGAPSQTA